MVDAENGCLTLSCCRDEALRIPSRNSEEVLELMFTGLIKEAEGCNESRRVHKLAPFEVGSSIKMGLKL